jgi:hypothetical protein
MHILSGKMLFKVLYLGSVGELGFFLETKELLEICFWNI